MDTLSIVTEVHAADVVHFDIKCANFILRREPDLDALLNAVLEGRPSGCVFIADFGESVPCYSKAVKSSSSAFKSLISRERGTLCVQSPEVLSLSESKGQRPHSYSPRFSSLDATGGDIRPSVNPVLSGDQDGQGPPLTPSATATKTIKADSFPIPGFQSDVWSLGCLFFELLTGRLLFAEQSWPELFVTLCLTPISLPTESPSATDTVGTAISIGGVSVPCSKATPSFSVNTFNSSTKQKSLNSSVPLSSLQECLSVVSQSVSTDEGQSFNWLECLGPVVLRMMAKVL